MYGKTNTILESKIINKLIKNFFLIIGNWNVKVGSQETPGITGKFNFGVQNEAG